MTSALRLALLLLPGLIAALVLAPPALAADEAVAPAAEPEAAAAADAARKAEFTIRASIATESSTTLDPETREIVIIGSPLGELLAQGYSAHMRDIDAHNVDLNARLDVLMKTLDGGTDDAVKMLYLGVPRALGLKVEWQERQGLVNRLRPVVGAPQLQPSAAIESKVEVAPNRLSATALPIQELVAFLRWSSPRPVLNETGLTERYDFVLEWDPSAGPGALFHSLDDIGLEMFPDEGSYSVLFVEKPE